MGSINSIYKYLFVLMSAMYMKSEIRIIEENFHSVAFGATIITPRVSPLEDKKLFCEKSFIKNCAINGTEIKNF